MIINWKPASFAEFGKTKNGTRVKLTPGTNEIDDAKAVLLSEDPGFKAAVKKGNIVIIAKAKAETVAAGDPWEGYDHDQVLEYVEGLSDVAMLDRVIAADNLPGNKGAKAAIVKAAKARVAEIKAMIKVEE